MILESIVKYVLDLLKLNYKFTIESFPYQSKNISDESYRDGAINIIYDKFSSECIKRTRIRRLLKNTFSKKSNKISVCGR